MKKTSIFLPGPLLLGLLLLITAAKPLPATADLQREMGRMVILENGRLKPLDTFARNLLLQISGSETHAGLAATTWLARLLFTPDQCWEEPLFLVKSSEARVALGLDESTRYFSLAALNDHYGTLSQLAQGAPSAGRTATPLEDELQRLFHNLATVYELGTSLKMVVPLDSLTLSESAAKSALGLPQQDRFFSYLQLYRQSGRLGELLSSIAVKRPQDRTPAESELLTLAANMKRFGESFANPLLAVIPPSSSVDETWRSPWEIVSGTAPADAQALTMLGHLAKAAASYEAGQDAAAAEAIAAFNTEVRQRAGSGVNWMRLKRELLYNRLHAFAIAKILYGAAFVMLLFFLLLRRRLVYHLSCLLLGAGLVLHSFGLVLRLLITGRAPVTNLYETFIFVAWVAALIGGISEWRQRKNLGLLAGACAGFMLLLISGRYAAAGDTMGMLVAVLNTNLWLSVHVTTVTMGYAGCVVAGIIGHIYVIQSLARRPDARALEHSQRTLYATLAFGLAFTFLGTVMGGIWADQSWGRFWGWDPKENGALLIILWTAILFHARKAGLIGPFGLAAGSVGAIIAVVLAWFGVNLLGVGLHAYGFVSGLNRALIAFLMLEILFLAGAAWLRRRRHP